LPPAGAQRIDIFVERFERDKQFLGRHGCTNSHANWQSRKALIAQGRVLHIHH
jgi:hypothetical protein